MGISRSSTIVIMYLMRAKGMKYEEAYALVKQQRSFIRPNPTFAKQLQMYEQQQQDK